MKKCRSSCSTRAAAASPELLLAPAGPNQCVRLRQALSLRVVAIPHGEPPVSEVPRNEVHVKVEDLLPRGFSVGLEEAQPICLQRGDQGSSHDVDGGRHSRQCHVSAVRHHVSYVHLRNDEAMAAAGWSDVQERNRPIVFV